MQCNVGKSDKNIRLALGTLIVLWGLLYQNWWGLIGLVLLITAFISWCPLYAVLGIKTCGHTDQKPEELSSATASSEEEEQKIATDNEETEVGSESESSEGEQTESSDEEKVE